MIRTKRNGLGLAGVLGTLVTLGVVACGDDFSGDDCKINHSCVPVGGSSTSEAGGSSDVGGAVDPGSGGSQSTGGMENAGGALTMAECAGAQDCDNGNAADGAEICTPEGTCEPGDAPPAVMSISPEDATDDVALDTSIVITFSEAVDAATLTEGSVKVLDGDTVVPATWQVDGATVTITPTGPLELWSTYDVQLSTDITDLAGIAMVDEFASSFTSRDGAWSTDTAVTGTVFDIARTLPVSESGHIYAGYLVKAASSELSASPTLRRFKEGSGVGAALVAGDATPQKRGVIDVGMNTAGAVAFGWVWSSRSQVQAFNEASGEWSGVREASPTSSVSDIVHWSMGYHADEGISIFKLNNYGFVIYHLAPESVSGPATSAPIEPEPTSRFATAFDSNGDGLAAWSTSELINGNPYSQISFSRYTAFNTTWSAPTLLPGSRASFSAAGYARSAPTIVMTPGGVAHVAWYAGAGGGAATLNAADFNGQAWSQPRLVSGDTQIDAPAAAPGLVAVGDTVVATWIAESATGLSAYTAAYDAEAEVWSDYLEHTSPESATYDPPSVASDARGNLTLAWTVDAGGGNNKLVYRRHSGQREEWSDVADVSMASFKKATGIAGPIYAPLGMNSAGRGGLMWAVQTTGSSSDPPSWNSVKVASFY